MLLAAFVLGIGGVVAMPETRARRPGALGALPSRVGVPRAVRGRFAAALPSLIALWALGGLYLSLGPSLAYALLASQNRLWGGLMIVLLQGVSAGSALLLRTARAPVAMLAGYLALLAAVAVTLGARATTAAVPTMVTPKPTAAHRPGGMSEHEPASRLPYVVAHRHAAYGEGAAHERAAHGEGAAHNHASHAHV